MSDSRLTVQNDTAVVAIRINDQTYALSVPIKEAYTAAMLHRDVLNVVDCLMINVENFVKDGSIKLPVEPVLENEEGE